MPTEDYKPVVSGSLKLKGVQDSGVKKKKKRPKPAQHSTSNQDSANSLPTAGETSADRQDSDADLQIVKQDKKEDVGYTERDDTPLHGRAKTEAEIRHEERRRKRVRGFYY